MPPRRKKRSVKTENEREKSAKHKSDDGANAKFKVVVLRIAMDEGRKCLTDAQYAHMVEVEKRLEHFGSPEEIADLRIEPIGKLYELKEKGGPLGRKNIRVFFAVLADVREVVILKTYKKEQDAQTPRYVVIGAEDRLDDYLNGRQRQGIAVYAGKTVRRQRPK